MENLVQRLADKLNSSNPNPWLPTETDEVIFDFIKDNESTIDESERKILENLLLLFQYSLNTDRALNFTESQRFSPSMAGSPSDDGVWRLAWEISLLLTQPVVAALLDDLMIEQKNIMATPECFDRETLYKRGIERYLIKVNWLLNITLDERPEHWDLAVIDALDRVIELSIRSGYRDNLRQSLTILCTLGEFFHDKKSWRPLLSVLESYLRVIENKKNGGLISEKERKKLVVWCNEIAQGFSEPGGLFNMIHDVNVIGGRIQHTLGVTNSMINAKRQTAELVEKVADQRAQDNEFFAAAAILDQAIIFAREANDQIFANQLSDKKVRLLQKAQATGEFKSFEYQYKLDKEDWEKFIEPFNITGTPKEALQLWINHPNFIPDYYAIEEHLKNNVSIIAQIASTAVLDRMGLQIARESEKKTGVDLHVRQDLIRLINLHAAMFLDPALEFIQKEKRVTADLLVTELEAWPLMYHDNMPIVKHGIFKHFEGDYISSIHILTPQFEAVLRRAFYQAGFPDAIDFADKKKGSDQQERMFGNFLKRQNIRSALGERLYRHFNLIFADSLGLNLRNRVAHGIIDSSELNGSISSLVLHSLMFLTLFREKEV